MVPISLNVAKSPGGVAALIDAMPSVLSSALNDALSRTRDRFIRETWPDAMAKGARGRKLTVKRKIQAGRDVVRVRRSDEFNLSGSIYVDKPTGIVVAGGLAGASAKAWIHAFVHSTSSRFAGKSVKQRINMALGAYYRYSRRAAYRQAVEGDRTRTDVFIRDFNSTMIEQALLSFPARAKLAVRRVTAAGHVAPNRV